MGGQPASPVREETSPAFFSTCPGSTQNPCSCCGRRYLPLTKVAVFWQPMSGSLQLEAAGKTLPRWM